MFNAWNKPHQCSYLIYIGVCGKQSWPTTKYLHIWIYIQWFVYYLYRMLKFWHVAFAFALPTGVYGSWGSVLDVNLKPFGISQVIYNNWNTICNNNYFVSLCVPILNRTYVHYWMYYNIKINKPDGPCKHYASVACVIR